jgi:hypothetical protein
VPIQILSSPSGSDTARELERAIAAAFPDARVAVQANGAGHFEIRVVSDRSRSRVASCSSSACTRRSRT